MVLRSVCLCDGEFIGIESIYTVIDGKQINKKDEVEKLRKKGREGRLLCPCGCGAKYILVAGDKGLREQHFRLQEKEEKTECSYQEEGSESIDAKVVLKCWAEEKLNTDDIECRVPANKVLDTDRRYEYTLLSRSKRVGILYSKLRYNLSDEKNSIIQSDENKVLYFVSSYNRRDKISSGQYPEWMMKIQEIQGYCMYLQIKNREYDTARLFICIYCQNIDGLWEEIEVMDSPLNSFGIGTDGEITFSGINMSIFSQDSKTRFEQQQEIIKQERVKQQEQSKKEREQRERELEERRIKAEEERRKLAERKAKEEMSLKLSNLIELPKPVYDNNGQRYLKCENCGEIKSEEQFASLKASYGKHNYGICLLCNENNPGLIDSINQKNREIMKAQIIQAPPANPWEMCPRCDGKLKIRNGRSGQFVGCSNYPRCNFTTPIEKYQKTKEFMEARQQKNSK